MKLIVFLNSDSPVRSLEMSLTIMPCAASQSCFLPYIGALSGPAAACQRSVLNANDRYRFHLNFNAMNGSALAHVGLLSGVQDVDIGMIVL